MKRRNLLFYATISGLLLTLSFPWPAWYPLVFLALVPVLYEISGKGVRWAFLGGWITGFTHFVTLLYWLVPVMVRFGGFPLPLSLVLHVLLTLYLGLYPALALAFSERLGFLNSSGILRALGFAFLWILMEALRARFFTGFPWEPLGAALALNPYLIQPAAYLGTSALSFLVALTNILLFYAVKWREWALRALSVVVVLLAVNFLFGWLTLPLDPPRLPFKVAIVQGNVPQEIKWLEGEEARSLKKYLDLSRKALACNPDFLLWPETAMPFFFPVHSLSRELISGIRDLGLPVVFGVPRLEKQAQSYVARNSVVAFSPEGEILGIYDKEHLVPFGEYIPFEKYFSWLRGLAVASGNYKPGRGPGVIEVSGHRLGVLICFENVFSELARRRLQAGAEVLLVVTNDAWFDESAALPQHFYHSVLRAVETRRYVIQVSNTGLSGLIDPYGRVLSLGPINREWVACF